MTVISAAEAALARAESAIAGRSPAQNGVAAPEEPLEAFTPPAAAPIGRKERDADRRERGEADHSITGLLLYALSTVRTSALMREHDSPLPATACCGPKPAAARLMPAALVCPTLNLFL